MYQPQLLQQDWLLQPDLQTGLDLSCQEANLKFFKLRNQWKRLPLKELMNLLVQNKRGKVGFFLDFSMCYKKGNFEQVNSIRFCFSSTIDSLLQMGEAFASPY